MTERERLIELLQEGNTKAGEHLREATKKMLAEKGCFNSKTDYDRRNIYEIEADFLLENGVIVPPCKVGDLVYVVYKGYVATARVLAFYIDREGGMFDLIIKTKAETVTGFETIIDKNYKFDDIYMKVEEAEKALKGETT